MQHTTAHSSELNFLQRLRRKHPLVLAIVFLIVLFNLEVYFFDGQLIFHFIFAFFSPRTATGGLGDGVTGTAGVISVCALIIAAYTFWLTFVSAPRYKIFYFILFSIATLIQFGYWKAVRRFFHGQDLFTWFSSPADLWLDSFQLFFDATAFIPILLYALFLVLIQPEKPRKLKSLGLIAFLTLVLAVFSHQVGEANYVSFAAPSFYQTAVRIPFTGADGYGVTREPLPVDNRAAGTPEKNVVLVIDESIRAEHLSIYGYPRETTPLLEQLQQSGSLVYWEDAISSSTCSALANSALITGINDLPDTNRRVFKNPTIFHYAKAMGYTTHYIDGSSSRLWNGLVNDDLLYVDHYLNRSDLEQKDKYDLDFHIARRMHDALKNRTGQFIVVNKVGVHFPYPDAYPAEEVVWDGAPPLTDNEALFESINHYDNAVRYNSELFFQTLMPDLMPLDNTTILYTSDHGQDLGVHSGAWSHCGNSQYELEVPIVLIGQLPNSINNADVLAHHFNIFPTLLDLLEVPEELRVVDYPVSLLAMSQDDEPIRYYLPGFKDMFVDQPLIYGKE